MYNNLHSMFGCYDYVDYYFTNNFLLKKELEKLKKEIKKEKEENSKLKTSYYNKQFDFLKLKYNFDILQDKYNNLKILMFANYRDKDQSKSDYEDYEEYEEYEKI